MSDSGFPWDPLGGHFTDLGLPYLLHGLRDGFFSGWGLEIMPGPDAWVCVKHGKYLCFDRFCFFDFFVNFDFSRLDFSDFWSVFWSPGELLAAGWL